MCFKKDTKCLLCWEKKREAVLPRTVSIRLDSDSRDNSCSSFTDDSVCLTVYKANGNVSVKQTKARSDFVSFRVPTLPGMPWKITLVLEMSWNGKVFWKMSKHRIKL